MEIKLSVLLILFLTLFILIMMTTVSAKNEALDVDKIINIISQDTNTPDIKLDSVELNGNHYIIDSWIKGKKYKVIFHKNKLINDTSQLQQ